METQKSSHGGKREGAGRKPTGRLKKSLSITGKESELNRLRQKAEESDETVSYFILSKLNCLDEQN